MATPQHAHRRSSRKAPSAARLGVAGAVTGVVGVAAVALLVLAVRPGGHGRTDAGSAAATSTSSVRTDVKQPKTGQLLRVSTPDGYGYAVGAVRSGNAAKPLASSRTSPPDGTTLAYIDYVLTNTGTAPALLDFPADLFVKKSKVPRDELGRCMPMPGAPADSCTLPDHSEVINTLGYPAPSQDDGDRYIPVGASYLVRVATDAGVATDVRQGDLGLYVWNPRFVASRQAHPVPFP